LSDVAVTNTSKELRLQLSAKNNISDGGKKCFEEAKPIKLV